MDFKGRARMIFALLGGILFLIAEAVFPGMPFTEEQTLLFMGLIAAYILGEGISGQTIGDNLFTLLKSQKFQALIGGLLVTTLKALFPNLPFDEGQLIALVVSLMAFIFGAGAQKNPAPQG